MSGFIENGYATMLVMFLLVELLPIPRTPLVITAGALFGLSAAGPILLASAVGGCIAFLLARSVVRDSARRLLSRRRMGEALLRAVDLEGVRLLALTRFASPVPTMLQNVIFGLTRIRFWPFALVTLAATAPQIVAYCYIGAFGRRVAQGDIGGAASMAAMAVILSFGAVVFLIRRRVAAILRAADKVALTGGEACSGAAGRN